MTTEEQVPLLPKSVEDAAPSDTPTEAAHTRFLRGIHTSAAQLRARIPKVKPTFEHNQKGKLVYYDHECLLTVKAFLQAGSSVFVERPVWSCLAYVLTISGICASAMFWVPSARSFDTARFSTFCSFLKVFISFMLAIYVQHSFSRWWNTVMCFEDFLIAIKQIMFFLHSIRVDPQSLQLVERLGIASAYVLNAELQAAECVNRSVENSKLPEMLAHLVEEKLLEDDEMQVLLKKEHEGSLQVCRTVWSWIAEVLTQMTKADGSPLLPPMFIRCLTLGQACISKIEHIKRNVTVQTPFAYAHLLAILVHLNNTLLAVFGGLALGSAMAEMMDRGAEVVDGGSRPSGHMMRNFYGAIQTCGGQMIIMIVEPMLYVGFLHIAHMLCYPFGDQHFNLPAETYINRLSVELNAMAENRQHYRKRIEDNKYLLGYVAKVEEKKKKDDDEEQDDEAGEGGGDAGGGDGGDCGDV